MEYAPLTKHQRQCRTRRQQAHERKIRVLTRYSPNQSLRCSWEGCKITDPQMLTLDHMDNNGAAHRRQLGSRSSSRLYSWLISHKFPKGFRTLCGGHNLKSEICRRIRERGLASD